MATKPRNQWGDALLHSKILQHMYGVLFHLTDCAHADSINEHGLLSKREASARGIHSPELINDFPGKGRWIAFLNYEVLVPKRVPRQFIIGCDP